MTPVALIDLLHREEGFLQGGGLIRDLPIWKDLPRLDRIPEADLPGADADLLRELIDNHLKGKFALAYAEAPEGPRGGIVGVIAKAPDVRVLIAVGSHGMRTGPLQHRSAERGIGSGIEVDLTVQAGKDAVLITAEGKGPLHRVALRVEIDGLLPGKLHLDRAARL